MSGRGFSLFGAFFEPVEEMTNAFFDTFEFPIYHIEGYDRRISPVITYELHGATAFAIRCRLYAAVHPYPTGEPVRPAQVLDHLHPPRIKTLSTITDGNDPSKLLL